jgi:hypothetical protein
VLGSASSDEVLMLSTSLTIIIALAILLGLVVAAASQLVRRLWVDHDARTQELVAHLRELLARRDERIATLEYQLAAHAAHVLKLPPPTPPPSLRPAVKPLPEVMTKFLEAIEGEDERAEFELAFRRALEADPEADPHRLVAEALEPATIRGG